MQRNKLRIIGGQWRGRQIPFAVESGVRPTPDRVRETVFNWLMRDIHNARCLDAFAGSGALGFEALSRGAGQVTFLDHNLKVIQSLKANAVTLDCQSQVDLHRIDTLDWFATPVSDSFDFIFLDPPFRQGLLEKNLAAIVHHHWLAPTGKIYVEAESLPSDDSLAVFGLEWYRQKQAGEVHYGLIRPDSSAG